MKKRISRLLTAVILMMTVMTAPAKALTLPELHPNAVEKQRLNSDTVGWLQVPGTDIDEVVLQCDDENDRNSYYYRRDFEKKYSFEGCYYADFRCVFGPGKLSGNTTIYGHSLSDDPDGKRFAQLLRYKDAKFAEEHPIIFFATTEETMAWQIFAVSIMTVDVPYNVPDLSDEERMQAVEKVRANSVHTYDDVGVAEKDRILTLSTVDYTHPYPSNYRYVIMAKRVRVEAE